MTDRSLSPPNNQEAEASVLGSVLISERALDAVTIEVGLRPEDFYRPRHGTIYAAMLALRERSEPIDALTVVAELDRRGTLLDVGGTEYVHSLPGLVPSAAYVRRYAAIVRDTARVRAVLVAAREVVEDVAKGTDLREVVARAEARLMGLATEVRRGTRPLGDVVGEEIERLERVARGELDAGGLRTGFRALDDLTGGLRAGNLIVVAARPGMGKSSLVQGVAESVALRGGTVLLFSLEMAEHELAQRFLAARARIRGQVIRHGSLTAGDWPKAIRAADALGGAPLQVDDSSDIDVLGIRAAARRANVRSRVALVVIDYLQLIRPDDPSMPRVEQISRVSRGLKLMARELDAPVVAVSQLSRAVESRPDKRPLLSDLRESGQIEADADLVAFVYRPEYYDPDDRPGEADVILAKHRGGPLGTAKLSFQDQYPRFADLAR